jgi:outer membrane protein assembly factor BamA
MAVELARFSRDRWRVRGLVSHVEVNYDFYGIGEDAGNAGVAVGINQTMNFAVASGLRRLTHGLYAGAAAMWLDTEAKPRDPLPPEIPAPANDFSQSTLVAPGLQAELDTRDDDYWPSHGSLAKLKSWFYASGLGSSRDFQRYTFFWSWYTRLAGDRLVLATNANALGAAGDVPFYALPSLGTGQGGLRGYTQGRYRDRVAITAQAEARYHTKGRFGATVFGGLGQVAPKVSDLGQAKLLPAGGLGLRYQLTRGYPMHMRFDYAWGKNEPLFYFSVAEAF